MANFILNSIETLLDGLISLLGSFIRVMLGWLQDQITNTPYPGESIGSPQIFSGPLEGEPFYDVYEVYTATGGIQDTALILWFIGVFFVFLGGTVQPLLPGSIDTEESKRKLFVAFLGIVFWWPIATFLLAFSDVIAELLYQQALTYNNVSANQGVFVGIYDLVIGGLQDQGTGGSAFALLAAIVFVLEGVIYLIVSVLWYIRYFFIYILTPLMPLVFATWSFGLPGLQPISRFAGKVPRQWVTLVFLTIPAAILTIFATSVVGILIEQMSDSNQELSGTGDVSTNYQIEPSSAAATRSPEVTFDPQVPLASLQEIVASSTTSEAVINTQSQLVGGLQAGAQEGVILLLITVMGLAIPLLIMATPWLMVKFVTGSMMTGLGAIVNPVGAASNALGGLGDFTKSVTSDEVSYTDEEEEKINKKTELEAEIDESGRTWNDLTADEEKILNAGDDAQSKAKNRAETNIFSDMHNRVNRYGASAAGVGAVVSDTNEMSHRSMSAARSKGGSAASKAGKFTTDVTSNPTAVRKGISENMKARAKTRVAGAVAPFARTPGSMVRKTQSAIDRVNLRKETAKQKQAGDFKAEYGKDPVSIKQTLKSEYHGVSEDELGTDFLSHEERAFLNAHGYFVKEIHDDGYAIERDESLNPAADQTDEIFDTLESIEYSSDGPNAHLNDKGIERYISGNAKTSYQIEVDDPQSDDANATTTKTLTVNELLNDTHDIEELDAINTISGHDLSVEAKEEAINSAINQDSDKLDQITQAKMKARLEGMGAEVHDELAKIYSQSQDKANVGDAGTVTVETGEIRNVLETVGVSDTTISVVADDTDAAPIQDESVAESVDVTVDTIGDTSQQTPINEESSVDVTLDTDAVTDTTGESDTSGNTDTRTTRLEYDISVDVGSSAANSVMSQKINQQKQQQKQKQTQKQTQKIKTPKQTEQERMKENLRQSHPDHGGTQDEFMKKFKEFKQFQKREQDE